MTRKNRKSRKKKPPQRQIHSNRKRITEQSKIRRLKKMAADEMRNTIATSIWFQDYIDPEQITPDDIEEFEDLYLMAVASGNIEWIQEAPRVLREAGYEMVFEDDDFEIKPI